MNILEEKGENETDVGIVLAERDREEARELIKQLKEPEKAQEAREGLLRIGRIAVPLLIELFADEQRADEAKNILIEIEGKERGTIGPLMRVLPNPWEKEKAIETLVEIYRIYGESRNTVVTQSIWFLGNPEMVESARSILLKISEKNAKAVAGPLVGGLAGEPERVEHVKDVLLEISERDARAVVGPCVKALRNPERVEHAKEVLLRIDKQNIRAVIRPCVGALRDHECREQVKEILLELSKWSVVLVVGPLIGALKNSDRVEHAKEVLLRISEIDVRCVAHTLVKNLSDPKIRESCKDLLVKLLNEKPYFLDRVLETWHDNDGFCRGPILDEIRIAARPDEASSFIRKARTEKRAVEVRRARKPTTVKKLVKC